MVIVSPYATHRLPKVWPNPEGFDPERFSEERAAGRSQFAYIPFGAGHRYCNVGFSAASFSRPSLIFCSSPRAFGVTARE